MQDVQTSLVHVFQQGLQSLAGVGQSLGVFGADLETSQAICNALAMLSMTMAGYVNLCMICIPYTKWRAYVVASMGVLSLGVFFVATYLLGDMLEVLCLASHGGALVLSLLGAVVSAFVAQVVALFAKRAKAKNK